MNILDDLDALASQSGGSDFDAAIMLTFTSSLRFFEELVLPRLERTGASRIAVLADRHGYESTLDSPIVAEHCGKKYVFNFNGRVTSLQHAKVLWLHGRRDIVWIGSHNLTAAGYNDQREVSARLDSADSGHLAALAECHSFISRLVDGVADVAGIWNRVPRPLPDAGHPADVHFLHSMDVAIGDQLPNYLPDGGDLRVVTPFLDADALNRLIRSIGARSCVLDIPYEGLDVPLDGVVKNVPELVVRRAGPEHRLHAKAYVVSHGEETTAAIGSANCTHAGLMRAAAVGGNVECIVVIPGGQLGDNVTFNAVTSVDDVPCTERTDEPVTSVVGLHIDAASYAAGALTVEWHASGSADSVTLNVGNRTVPCSDVTMRIEFEGEPPSIVSLSGRFGDEWQTARRWVTFPERLEEFAASRGVHRLRQYVGSDDPRSWFEGFDYVMGLLLDVLRHAEPEVVRGGRTFSGPRRSATETSDALEILAYSRDRDAIDASVARLIIGDERTDVLAAIRALLRRMMAPVVIEGDVDDDDSERRSEQQRRAASRAVDRLIAHVRFLADSQGKIATADEQQARPFLALSFAAVALAWRHLRGAIATQANSRAHVEIATQAERKRFAEAGLHAVTTLARSERGSALIRDPEVAGPFVLALSAFAEAGAGEDSTEFQAAARAILDRNPKEVVADWQESHPDLAGVLSDVSNVESWAADALALFGVPSVRVQLRQQDKWGLFLKLYDADLARAPEAARLFKEADEEYETEEVWRHYKTMRGKARILTVRQATCSACFQRLPLTKERAFKTGDPVACRCGAILIFRE